MPGRIRVLIIEDASTRSSIGDGEISALLSTNADVLRTGSHAGLLAALEEFAPALIFCNHPIPQFDWREALGLVRERLPHIPFFVLAEGMDKEGALDWAKTGGSPARISYGVGVNPDGSFSSQYQASLLDNVSDAIIATDLSFVIRSWNKAAEKIYGWKAEEVVGKATREILGALDDDSGRRAERHRQILEQGNWSGELREIRRDNAVLFVQSSISLLRAEDGRPIGAVGVSRDITERRRAEETRAKLEEQLRQAQKMESIGRLAGGVAHDFNNLLTVIRGYCEIMKEKTPPGAPLDKDLDQVMAAEQKAAALTSQLLAFSRKQILAPRLVSLNDLVSNLQKMLERIIGEDITLSTILESGLRSVFADPGQIEQVIMNFVVNARDAMPTGGVLTVETRNVDLDEAYGRSHFGVPLGPCVLLTFSDNGRGMDARVQAHIFEPFFSTKEPGKGTGLGLATSYGIVKQSGGEILAYSEPGRGTTFKIYLPAIQAEAESPAALQAPIASRGGTETILLVEDNDMVRSLAKSTLRAKGYNVLEAVDGRELAEELAPLRPNMKVLYMSGYTDDAVLRHGILAAGVEFISKPFMPSALAAKVRDVLDA